MERLLRYIVRCPFSIERVVQLGPRDSVNSTPGEARPVLAARGTPASQTAALQPARPRGPGAGSATSSTCWSWPSGSVALVQPLAPSSRFGGATGLAQSLAGTATADLEIAGQSAAARRRGRSDPTLPSARPALRQPGLGGEHRESVGAGVHPPRAPPAAKGPAVRNGRNISEPVPLSSPPAWS